MRLEAEDYRDGALERINTARNLYTSADYAPTVYFAGLAVECMLRAYRVREDPTFDSRHDLADLLKASGLENFVPEKRRAEISAALGDVWARWKNDYRFTSSDRLLRALRKRGLTFGIRGDALKENARIILNAGYEIVNMGALRWKKNG